MSNEEIFQLFGTRQAEAKPRRLVAGRLTAELSGGNLRNIRYDGVEILRGIAYLVRDRDWGTYDPEIHDLCVETGEKGCNVSYQARCLAADASELVIDVCIAANADGRLSFTATAQAPAGFETNRCGFCILHPIVGLAGTAVRVEHVDGKIIDTQLPDLIEPWQPFQDMRAITHRAAPGITVECRLEGDTFEMEDQRNWSDASFKTYVRPLALPWPYQIEAGIAVTQAIELTITDQRPAKAVQAATPATAIPDLITITPDETTGAMPAIGLIITPDQARPDAAADAVLREIAPQELLFHFDPLAGHANSVFEDYARLAEQHGGRIGLEIALPCQSDLLAETRAIANAMRAAGFKPDHIMISPAIDRQSTPPGSKWPPCPPLADVYAAARAAFPDVRLGGGMLSYFTELNRKRVPADGLDFISHCTNPIVHAADDVSVMQTLEALPFITRSVRAIYGDKPYRIGPSTIAMRQNPYGSRTMANPQLQRMAMADRDPRHNGRFAEAFAMAYAIAVLDADVECLTLSALSGDFGLIAGPDEPVTAGGRRPLFNTISTLARAAGAGWRRYVASDPSRIMAFAIDGDRLWLINITSQPQQVILPGGERIKLSPYQVLAVRL